MSVLGVLNNIKGSINCTDKYPILVLRKKRDISYLQVNFNPKLTIKAVDWCAKYCLEYVQN